MGQVLWSILGKPGKKFVIIISETQEQAKNHFANIKAELETNERLKKDFGPFIEHKDDVGKIAMELFYHGAKILSVPREEPLRGLKFGEHRPDLIILDDVEDSVSAHDRANRRSAMPWFESEIVPVGTTDTRIVVLGNLLHKESFIMQLREAILAKSIKGVFRAYPLFDDDGSILWLDKFPNQGDVDALMAKSSYAIFAQEYLLRFASASNAMAKKSDSEDEVMEGFRKECYAEMTETYKKYAQQLRVPRHQTSLIPQMEAYRITAPDETSIPTLYPDDPQYELYQKFESEIRESVSRWLRKNNEYANRK